MDRRVLYIIYVMIFSLFAASCSESAEVVARYVDVEISTAIEANYSDEAVSRAESEVEVDDSEYDMRYTIELWSDDHSEIIYRYDEVVADISANLTHSFRAVAGDYRLVIFADYVEDAGETTHYTTTNGLNQITMASTSYTANNASRDCYGYSEDIEISSSFALSGITLKRPMAKMTLADTTPANVTGGENVVITYSKSIPNGYDLLNGEVITTEAVTATYPATTVASEVIAFDYIFISGSEEYLMTFEVGDKEVSSMIYFEENKTTNIKAKFFETVTLTE